MLKYLIVIGFCCVSLVGCNRCKAPKRDDKQTVKTDSVVIDDVPVITQITVEEDLFRVNFPETPEKSIDSADRAVQYMVSQYGDSVRYSLYYRDYKPQTIESLGEQKFLENQKRQVIETHEFTPAEIQENKPVDLQGYKGFWLRAGSKSKFFLVYVIYMVENRVYQLSISNINRYPTSKEIDDFFKSFQLKSPLKTASKS
jgi:hypothetical protein